jgi:Ca2+-binding RTX toxin-like protein
MAYEVNNLISPYYSVARIFVWFSYADYQADVQSNFTTQHYVLGSGAFIDGDDVLTASHIVYDSVNQRVPYRVEVVPGYDSSPGEVPYGVFRGSEIAYFNNFDPNRDGLINAGDGVAGTLAGTELDMAVIHLSVIDPPPPTSFWLGVNFVQGSLHITGYPGSANGNPMEELVFLRNGPSPDNNILTPVALGAGSSGGPVWAYTNGVPAIYGVVSTIGAIAEVTAHASWIQAYTRLNDDLIVGSAASDIFRPAKADFLAGKLAGFRLTSPFQYIEEGGSEFFGGRILGQGGLDTIAIPWSSGRDGYWYIEWSKNAAGFVSGTLFSNSSATTFESIERLAFSNIQYDLLTSAVGVTYRIGNAGTPVTSLDQLNTNNPVQYRIFTAAGSDQSDLLFGTLDNDQMSGFAGNDTLIGYDGKDLLNGGTGADSMQGGNGADVYVVDNNLDVVSEIGGDGLDVVQSKINFSLASSTSTLGTVESLTLLNLSTAVLAVGNAGGNAITGNSFSNTLVGGGGNDTLNGAGGVDVLAGNAGIDTLWGGLGNDFFVVNSSVILANRDVVRDFANTPGNNDAFRLENLVMPALGGPGPLKAAYFFSGPAAHDADDHIIYNKTSGNIFYDTNGIAAGGATLLATVTNKPTLTAADFIVV